MAPKTEVPKNIVLTENPEILAKLERKLIEYCKRGDDFIAPEVAPELWLKRTILGDLLECGQIDAETFFGKHDVCFRVKPMFGDALAVIDCYNRNDLGDLIGGTGLK